MENTDKKYKLNSCYNELHYAGKVNTKKEFAEIIGISYPNLIQAMKGDEKYLTDRLLIKINHIMENRPRITTGDNNTQVAGNGNNINNASTIGKALDEIAEQRKLVSKSQEQIDRLISIIEKFNQ